MKLKTAESVTSGHPDKLADYIADCILDECMAQDPESRVAYGEDDKFIRIASVLVSVQHSEDAEIKALRKGLLDLIIKPALGEFDISQTEIIINPSGRFVKGGFEADTGLTGRKLMVDTYGGLAHHGGGAMSGKDPSKVDRSGAYMARYIANAIIKAELASECEVSIAYAIGKAQPTAVNVDTFGTWAVAPSRYITEAVKRAFDLTPAGIIRQLRLKGTSYRYTAINGHFGCEKGYPWENVDSATVTRLKNALNEVIESEEES